ncbi:MAG: ABC transporter substrate-binding protein [Gordonibacter sp.]|nr:ABC transporter substrate-binding protein [Gordonibacter sp.]
MPSSPPTLITRRTFIQAAGLTAVSLAGGGLLTSCTTLDEFFSGQRVLADHTGRDVTIPTPSTLSKVYFTSALAQVFCFTMAPDLLAGTAIPFTSEQLEYLPLGSSDLVYMGSLAQGGVIDTEMLRLSNVQLIFSISGTDLTDVNIADALQLQDQTGIPVFLIDGSFDRIGDTYRLLGNALGRPERAEELAAYCERVYRDVTQAVTAVPDERRVRYYFAEGPEGLQTEPNSSQHSLAFQVAGGVNVAADLALSVGRRDMADTTVKQIAGWDPEVIIAWDWQSRGGADQLIRATSSWAGISAVREGRVYAMPHVPFPFCDRPPGVNRFLGIQWLANLFYPNYYDVDMVEVVREFCATCYWRDISRAQAEQILGRER